MIKTPLIFSRKNVSTTDPAVFNVIEPSPGVSILGEAGDAGTIGLSGLDGVPGPTGMKGTQGPVGLPGLPGIPAPPLPRYPPTTADTMYIPVMFNGKVPRTMCHHISKKAYGEYKITFSKTSLSHEHE